METDSIALTQTPMRSRYPKDKEVLLERARIWSNMNRLSLLSSGLLCVLFCSSFAIITLPLGSDSIPSATNVVNRSLAHFATYRKTPHTNNTLGVPNLRVSLLQPIDYQKFTVRINTWKREEQLRISVQHHLTCPSVAQIQIVWCVDQGPVPPWLLEEEAKHAIIVVEQHVENSLNERFRVLTQPPTAAVLSIDDDVLRPCLALESAFLKWTANPDRQIGFDARSHQITKDLRWKYGYMSTTERTNAYSITLTRFCFLHRDYLHSYWDTMPERIRRTVAEHLNCEDIAMSLWISSRTDSLPPLLADFWAVKSQIKLYVPSKISGGQNHKGIRDDCMNDFADILQLKDRLKPTKLLQHKSVFEYGAIADNWNAETAAVGQQRTLLEEMVAQWKVMGPESMMQQVVDLISEAQSNAYNQGLIEGSSPWKKRFHHGADS